MIVNSLSGHAQRRRRFTLSRYGLTVLLATLLGALLAAPVAHAEQTKFYNEAHSLLGGCFDSATDHVLDPGCPEGPQPPEGPFVKPSAVATDAYGDIYVLNQNESQGYEAHHVDIYDPQGHYIAEVAQQGAHGIAVDSTGHLYVNFDVSLVGGARGLVRYDPTVYEPEAGKIAYGSPPVTISSGESRSNYMAVDFTDDHFFLRLSGRIVEYGPPTDGVPNEVLTEEIGEGTLATFENPNGAVAVDATRQRLYTVDWMPAGAEKKTVIRYFNLQAPYELLGTIDGSTTPSGNFGSGVNGWARTSLAVDEAGGHLFAGDISSLAKLYELEPDGTYVGQLANPVLEGSGVRIAVDNSEASPNQGYLYVPSGVSASSSHLYAYEPKSEPEPPAVEAVSAGGVTEDEAVLRATINPKSEPAHWSFEYTTQADFEAEGFAAAQLAGEGEISAGNRDVKVSAPATGLLPGTTYRFRVVAVNQCLEGGCSAEKEGSFTTFLAPLQTDPGGCPNKALRTGPSAALPDCRAYELVSPADTGGLIPIEPQEGGASGSLFPTPTASPTGDSLVFRIPGGVLPGFKGGVGGFWGDDYVATRTAAGWDNQLIGPDGSQASYIGPGGLSAEHGYYAFEAGATGSLVIDGAATDYVRYPDGSFHLAGEGDLATAPQVTVHYIAPQGSHLLFTAELQLEPEAPPVGAAVYDRTPQGLAVVSLLPGDVTPSAPASYEGSSRDGSAVAFRIFGDETLYVRLDDAETLHGAPAGAEYAGFSADGRYLFYMLGGDLYRFDTQGPPEEPSTEEALKITTSADITPVNIASGGTAAYFLSPTALPTGPNPLGAEPQEGKENLYHWDGSSTRFVATVTERDAEGKPISVGTGTSQRDGLGIWLEMEESHLAQAILSSRTTPDGGALLFESRAELTGFQSGGKAEIYRYDAAADTLGCLSCDATGATPAADARLLRIEPQSPIGEFSEVPNLSANGARAFFETPERLVNADNDALVDVYEWEVQGEGSCAQQGGCLFLISSGQSARDNTLYGLSESGEDVFILSGDLLAGGDADETTSVYDARVEGGFPPPPARAGECLGEACQPAAVAPDDPTPASAAFQGAGNVTEKSRRRCPKGRRAVRRAGKTRCVARHKKHRQQRQGGAKGRGQR
jgi:hypothetical protein